MLQGTGIRISPHVLVWAGRCLCAKHRRAGPGRKACTGTPRCCGSAPVVTPCGTAGLDVAGAWSIGFQWGSLALALILSSALAQPAGMHALAGGLVASRFGLWAFDLAASQMLQERVPSEQLGEALLCSVTCMLLKLLCCIAGALNLRICTVAIVRAHSGDWHHWMLPKPPDGVPPLTIPER